MSNFSNIYRQTLEYLFGHLPMFQRTGGVAYKKDLTNIRALCDFLGNPQDRFPTIHVAGTNGKGSTCYMLAAVLQAHGLRTGLYISPHYKDFRERVRIDGEYVSKKFVVEFTERMKPLIEEIEPSFFEIGVAMAFEYFAQSKVDVAVIEVGMGGRLDSTNIIKPLVSVITNISFDHMQFLGDTLPLIAGEKAGIIKPDVPVVIGETHPETQPVFDAKAAAAGVPIVYADQHFRADIEAQSLTHTTFQVWHDGQLFYPDLDVNVHADYQAKNLQTVLQTIEILRAHWPLDEQRIRAGLYDLKKRTRFIGRWQLLGESPIILADSGHNEDGLRQAMQQLSKIPHRQLRFVLGVVSDKDIGKMLAQLPQSAQYYFAKAAVPRGMNANILQEKAALAGLQGKAYSSVKSALNAAKRHAAPDDLIYVGGSTFVVAEVV
ncbi:MAG TPA: folylpolyglutamate synthase/dihydrofolate synthase family protein [Saprospiraceae bacterium]|nr:folylpolyglutamate synthase/dihydrofolate synthase family protein [Saprospiraceae bacterium]HMP24124.1 folylpolyglutamate synthase/dihydrofolate synthase family protein [Saprospiraceae bacterium]